MTSNLSTRCQKVRNFLHKLRNNFLELKEIVEAKPSSSNDLLLLLICVHPIIFAFFSQLSFDSEMYTKSITAADFVNASESNESCEKH